MAIVQLGEREARLFTKLYVSANDISLARQWAEHLQKKKWYRRPWSRGKIYLHQSAYVTAIVVAYGRVFAPGRGQFNFPERLIPYDVAEWDLHKRLLELRHSVHAHSDLDKWRVEPWEVGGFRTTIVGQPIHLIEKADVELFLVMTKKLLDGIADRQEQILGVCGAPVAEGSLDERLIRLTEAMERLEVGETMVIPFDA
jgi:hypothetical protein